MVAAGPAATPFSPFRAGTVELHAFTGYAWIDKGVGLGDAHYEDNVPDSAPLVGLRIAYNLTESFGGELELQHSRTGFRRDNHGVTILGVRADALLHLGLLGNTLRPFALLGLGFEKLLQPKEVPGDPLDSARADLDPALYAGLGTKYYVTDRLSFRIGGRVILSEKRDGPILAPTAFELLAGGAVNLLIVDQDPDHDGIATSHDECPLQPEDRDGWRDTDGCPDSDNDADGIADEVDKCPLEKENPNGVDDDDGCPDQDADGDLVEDRVDRCPHEAEDRDGFADDDGCPDPDNDGDGVFDAADKCPDKLETHNGFNDDDGCPDTVPKKVAREFRGRIDGIYFAVDSADIDAKSDKVLGKALAVLVEFKGVRLEIGGHTDNTGLYEYNLDLSRRRAQAVKAWFVARGIDASRLVAVGYGRSRPVAPNTSEAGRARNRRIEFTLLVRKGR